MTAVEDSLELTPNQTPDKKRKQPNNDEEFEIIRNQENPNKEKNISEGIQPIQEKDNLENLKEKLHEEVVQEKSNEENLQEVKTEQNNIIK